MQRSTAVTFAAVVIVATAGCVTVAHPAHAQPPPPPPPELAAGVAGTFYDDLSPYGQWIDVPSYGWAWRPYGVAADWRPYSMGHWVWSDEYGWLWVSSFVWGWAPFHYGRWVFDPRYGWVWIPGDVWGPA